MRIALVQDFLRTGGTERQTIELADAFAARGHVVMLLTFRPGGALDRQCAAAVRRVALQRRDWGLDWFAPGLVATLREFRPDVVQVMGRMANCHGWRLVRALPTSAVVATYRTGRPLPRWYVRTLRSAAAVIANSRHAAARAIHVLGVPEARVHVVHNALVSRAAEADENARADVRAELGTGGNAQVFLCCAMLRPGKGHRELIEIAAALDRDAPWELWIAGDGSERNACEALVRRHGLDTRVRLLGRRGDTGRLYAAADVAVLSSHTESSPNFLVEAQWHGLPVVAWDVAGVGETFRPEASGILVPEHDRPGFAAALHALALDPARRTRMSLAAREHARATFDPDRQHARYLELYAAIRKSRPAT
ncbi:glycosyltransferase [Congregicoccus parvus]|uniref:glycosyltransferase n=1 Tax=Congregicoccus parvus TaxID=3081749 RepID=UPI003FA57223